MDKLGSVGGKRASSERDEQHGVLSLNCKSEHLDSMFSLDSLVLRCWESFFFFFIYKIKTLDKMITKGSLNSNINTHTNSYVFRCT